LATIHSIFVYGTLKQFQLRAPIWPRKPTSIQPAVIRAALYDTGPFPAILVGDDWVLGELWTLAINDMPTTLDVLDEVEGFSPNRDDNLYVRIVKDATLEDGTVIRTFTYQYASNEQGSSMRRIEPFASFAGYNCAAWPDRFSQVPKNLADEERFKI